MNQKCNKKDIQFHHALSFAVIGILFLILGFYYDYYYDLNDDVLIKDIVSGAYSGEPSAHSIQMLYPVSWLISVLYKIIPALPWYGIFLCGCQGISFYLIMQRSLSLDADNDDGQFGGSKCKQILLAVTEGLLIASLCTWEFTIVQYTVTSALLAAAACFLVYTQKPVDNEGNLHENVNSAGSFTAIKPVTRFLKQNALAIVLVILAFNIRSEMLLLMSPFIALTGILKWSKEKSVFAKETIKKYLGLIGVILLGMGLSLVIDVIAYSSEDWKEFRDFFDARTQVYDYTWYPAYEEAEEFYHEIGASEVQVTLIDNYNFGLDEAVDADMLWDIAKYAEATGVKEPLLYRLNDAFADYKWRTFHEQDAPYNYVVLAAYAMVFVLAVLYKDKSAVWKLPVMIVFRTIPWMYVIISKRVPARISHPLYFIELVILCAWILEYFGRKEEYDSNNESSETTGRKKSKVLMKYICFGVFLSVALVLLPTSFRNVSAEMNRRESVNELMQEFDAYAKANPDNYYYMDVYSTVDFSEKMFKDVDNSQKNYDILGGWACGSPLQKQTTARHQQEAFARAELLLQDNFYFVCDKGTDTEFLKEFYRTMGIIAGIQVIDEISEGDRTLAIYKITPNGVVNHE